MALPRDYFIGGLFFIILLVGGITAVNYTITGQTGSEADTGVPNLMANSQQLQILNESVYPDNLTNDIEELKSDIQDFKVDNLLDGITLPIALINTAWDSINFIANGFSFMANSIKAISGYFEIPTWITYIVILIVVSFFVFSILSIVFGKDI